MANISQIKLPNGTTYNIKDSISGYTTNIGTITRVKTTAGAHTTIDVSSGAATFNVPTKTSHLTNDSGFITNAGVTGVKGNAESSYRTGQVNLTAANVGAAASSHTHDANSITSVRESEITWGNKDFSANYSVGDVFLNDALRANRFAGLRAEGITVEYSRDNGSTWSGYETTDLDKRNLFTINGSYLISGSASRTATTSDQLRITVDTGLGGIYSYLNKFHIYISTNGSSGCTVSIDAAPSDDINNFNKTICTDAPIAGWSGWNVIHIPFSFCTAYTSQSSSSNYRKIRFLFKHTGIDTTYKGLQVLRIFAFGGVGYNTPSTLALNGHVYTFDGNMNVTFPAKVTATSFSGPLTGNVTGNVSGTATNVTGTVAIANGGTGQTTAANAINALLNGLPTWTADPTDTTYFIRQDTGGSATYGKVQATTLWNYISGKLPAWSKASTKPSYNFSEIGSTPTTLSGYGITDAKIASGTITLGSNTITPLTSSSTLNAAKLSGAIPSAVTATTQTAGDNSTKIATTAFVSSAISGLPTPMQFIGTVGTNGTTTWANLPAASGHNGYTYKVITAHTAEAGKPAADVGDALISNGTEWIVIPAGDETATQSATTGISIAAHGTGTVIGVQSTTTTASKVTVSSSSTDYGVKSAGSASTWTFEEKTIPNVTSAGTASSWTFEEKTIPNVTSAGSASTWAFTSKTVVTGVTFAMDTTDTKKLKITTSTDTVYSKSSGSNGTAPTLGTAIKVQSKSGGSNGTAPTLGTAIKVQSKSGGANSTAPTLGSKVPTVSASDVDVPIKNASASTFVTGTTHTVTDNGHTHTI